MSRGNIRIEARHYSTGAWGAACLSCYCRSSMQARPIILVVWLWKKTRRTVSGSQLHRVCRLGEGCQNSTRKWEGEVLVKVTAPDQDSNRASLACGERTGTPAFPFSRPQCIPRMFPKPMLLFLVLHHRGF